MVGVSGGEYGVRGFITALDAETGNEAWKTYTVARPGDPAADTWKGDSGRPAAARSGSRAATIRRPTSPISAPAMAVPGPRMRGRATTSTPRRRGARPRQRQDQGPPPYHWNDAWDWDEVSGAGADRHRARRQNNPGRDPCRPQRLSLDDGAQQGRTVELRRWQAVRVPERLLVPRPEDRPADLRPVQDPGHQPARRLCPGLWGGKDCRRRPTTRRPGCSTLFRPTTTCARNWPAPRPGRASPANSISASRSTRC